MNTSLCFCRGGACGISASSAFGEGPVTAQVRSCARYSSRFTKKINHNSKPTDGLRSINLNEFLGKALEPMSHSLWHVPLRQHCVWSPLPLLQEPQFPLVTPQLHFLAGLSGSRTHSCPALGKSGGCPSELPPLAFLTPLPV